MADVCPGWSTGPPRQRLEFEARQLGAGVQNQSPQHSLHPRCGVVRVSNAAIDRRSWLQSSLVRSASFSAVASLARSTRVGPMHSTHQSQTPQKGAAPSYADEAVEQTIQVPARPAWLPCSLQYRILRDIPD